VSLGATFLAQHRAVIARIDKLVVYAFWHIFFFVVVSLELFSAILAIMRSRRILRWVIVESFDLAVTRLERQHGIWASFTGLEQVDVLLLMVEM
jgi:hypothetical protein